MNKTLFVIGIDHDDGSYEVIQAFIQREYAERMVEQIHTQHRPCEIKVFRFDDKALVFCNAVYWKALS